MQTAKPFIELDRIITWVRTAPLHHKLVLLSVVDLVTQGKAPSSLEIYNAYSSRARSLGLVPLKYTTVTKVLKSLEEAKIVRRSWFSRRRKGTKKLTYLLLPPEAVRDIFRYLYPSWSLLK